MSDAQSDAATTMLHHAATALITATAAFFSHSIPGRAAAPGLGRAGRDVGGEGGQLRAGPRRERLADPQVELVLGEPSMHERGLEQADHLLTFCVRRPQATTACCARHLAARLGIPCTSQEHDLWKAYATALHEKALRDLPPTRCWPDTVLYRGRAPPKAYARPSNAAGLPCPPDADPRCPQAPGD